MPRIPILAASCLLLIIAPRQSNAAVLISVDNSGSPRNINATSSATWNFYWGGVAGYTFDNADFSIQKDQGTIGSIVFTLWSGYGGDMTGNSVLTSVSLDAADVTTSYQSRVFNFPGALTLSEGAYSVQLTSSITSANDFHVKTGKMVLYDGSKSSPLSTALYNTDGNTTGTSVPETSSTLLSAATVIGMLACRRRQG